MQTIVLGVEAPRGPAAYSGLLRMITNARDVGLGEAWANIQVITLEDLFVLFFDLAGKSS